VASEGGISEYHGHMLCITGKPTGHRIVKKLSATTSMLHFPSVLQSAGSLLDADADAD
jgi:hypothetical protein